MLFSQFTESLKLIPMTGLYTFFSMITSEVKSIFVATDIYLNLMYMLNIGRFNTMGHTLPVTVWVM